MTPEEVTASLSAAYDRMTADEIRGHARSLALCLQANDEALASMTATAAGSRKIATRQGEMLRNISLLTRQAASAVAVGDQATSSSIVLSLAIATGNLLDPPPIPALPDHVPLLEVWPDAFSPEGSENGR